MTMDEPFEILRDIELRDEPVHSWLTAPIGPETCEQCEHLALDAERLDGPGWREARRDDSWFRILP